VPRVKAKPTRRGTGGPELTDAHRRVLDAVRKQGGLPLGELALAARVNKHALKATLKPLVRAGHIEARGVRAGTRYWPKEAL
jgi:DNA-binding MarR family transcriptional regulator